MNHNTHEPSIITQPAMDPRSELTADGAKPTPTATIIIVNYNGGEMVIRCLRSVFLVSSDAFEVILVDNASTDGSTDTIRQLFPELRVIRSRTNLGFGAANNLAACHAAGQYLAFLNPDTIVTPGWLEELIRALELDPRAGLATSRILLADDPTRINACGNDVHCSGLTLCRGIGKGSSALSQREEVQAISGAAFAIRRDLFEMLGGFDETFFLYMEDTDLSWRARLAGYWCIYVPSSVVYHEYELCFRTKKIFYHERNRYLMLFKSLHWQTLLALLPILLLAEIVTWGYTVTHEPRRLWDKLSAYFSLFRHRHEALNKRRQTQAIRCIRDVDLLQSCTYQLAFKQTGDGLAQQIASIVFNPLFFALQRVALKVIRW